MGKKIILLSDGTGNSAAKVWRTNVWRVFESLDLSGSDQIAFYDDGVGTSSFKPLAFLGGAFGYGLKRNVLDIYKFLCRNYKSRADYRCDQIESDDDEIFAFGFSRGAFTIRVVVGLVADQGLVAYHSEAELERNVRAAYRAYRSKNFKTKFRIEVPFRFLRSFIFLSSHDPTKRPVERIRFLGLWDTVAAYGLPVDEMTRGVSRYLWPLELPDKRLDPKVQRACHALSLDDERTTFHPVLWDESNERPPPTTPTYETQAQRITQIWFAGMHSNVGGGYPDDSLAGVSLNWMMEEAAACWLRFKGPPRTDPNVLLRSKSAQDKDGRIYDSRSGLGGYYRYGPRDVHELCNHKSKDPRDNVVIGLPKIHETVLERIKLDAHLYAPIGIPQRYAVVTRDKFVHAAGTTYESDAEAETRFQEQTLIWNTIWRRRAVYFLTVFASLYLICYPLVWVVRPFTETSSQLRFVTDILGLAGAFLPTFADRWLRAYTNNPLWFLEWATIVGGLIYVGATLGSKITDNMRSAWNRSLCKRPESYADSKKKKALGQITLAVLLIASLYVICYPIAKRHYGYNFAPPKTLDDFLSMYAGTSIPTVLVLFSLVFLMPTSLIQRVRLSPTYREALRRLKLTVAPFLFAVAFVIAGFGFANHYLFSIRDGMGSFCKPTEKPESVSEKVTLYFDIATNRKISPEDAASGKVNSDTESSAICFATGRKLDRNTRYIFSIEPVPTKNQQHWTFWRTRSSTGGITVAGFPLAESEAEAKAKTEPETSPQPKITGFIWWKRLVMPLLYPLRRTLDRPWGSIITRFGPEGNEENFIDPDSPSPNERQSEALVPKRDGELFVYLNKPHLGIWGTELWLTKFINADGIAKMTLERKRPLYEGDRPNP
jgi:uncharacterized protein (DUF2235 family)